MIYSLPIFPLSFRLAISTYLGGDIVQSKVLNNDDDEDDEWRRVSEYQHVLVRWRIADSNWWLTVSWVICLRRFFNLDYISLTTMMTTTMIITLTLHRSKNVEILLKCNSREKSIIKGLASYCWAETTFTFHFSISTFSNAL